MTDNKSKKLRRDNKPNFSCSMNPDDKKILQSKREDTGLSWEGFFSFIVEIIKPVRSVDDFVDLKRMSQRELRRDDKR